MLSFDREQVRELYELPFMDLIFQAQGVHREYHDPNVVQLSTLLSIKTGACVEDCGYCSQSARYKTGLKVEPLMESDVILENARKAKLNGATRFCMGASWKNVPDKEMEKLNNIISEVKELGLETCMTLGGVSKSQAQAFKEAGLDYYNHNLDTSREKYSEIITTRTFDDRLETIRNVREAGINVCSGGILGLGETREDRIGLLLELANLNPQPESVPINNLVTIKGTPLADQDIKPVDPFEFIRTIAVARILMPKSYVRLSAGREQMSEEIQALCFLAGANSIFYGEKLLTTPNPETNKDFQLFKKLGIQPAGQAVCSAHE